jgi:sugar lactone lactonase YvrE
MWMWMQVRTRNRLRLAIGLGLALGIAAPRAHAISAAGYTVTEIALPDFAQGDVVVAGGALFVGVGPGFSGAAQSVVRIDGGGTTVVADGFNALSGFAWDAVNDRLLVTDNADEAPGSETGDTLYGIAAPHGGFATPLRAADIALLPAGSIPGISDIVLDPTDPTGNRVFVTDASEGFPPAGRVLAIDIAAASLSVVQSGLGYAAGLAASADALYFGDVNGFTFQGSVSSVALPGATGAPVSIVGGLGGLYDLELEASGMLLATAYGDLLRIDPATGANSTVASGFGFATGLFEDGGTIWVLDGGYPGAAKVFRLDALPVPEPGTALLLAFGAGALSFARRRGELR